MSAALYKVEIRKVLAILWQPEVHGLFFWYFIVLGLSNAEMMMRVRGNYYDYIHIILMIYICTV